MEDFAVSWWLWIVFGIVLLAGEILTPGGFYIFFFGASAVCVGLLKLLGFTQGLVFEGLLFAGLAICGVAFLRKPLMQRFQPPQEAAPDADRVVGKALFVFWPPSRIGSANRTPLPEVPAP